MTHTTGQPVPDLPLLRKLNSWVQEQALIKDRAQREWFQPTWIVPLERRREGACGTAYCFAGYVAHLAGPVVGVSAHDGQHVADFAREALGLTEGQSGRLFYAGNTAEDIDRIVRGIFADAGEEY